MSAEVAVKKRGRPKKVVLDSVEVDVPETKKSPSRAKSTKATTSTKSKTATPTRTLAAAKTVSKPIEAPPTSSKASAKPTTAPTPAAAQKVETSNFRPPVQSPVTPETSKILSKVRDLAAKNTQSSTQPPSPEKAPAASIPKPTPSTTTASKPAPSQTPPPAKPSTPMQTKPSAPVPSSSSNAPKPASTPPSSTNVPPKAAPKIPIAALNSAVVSKLSERAGARPNNPKSQQLPPNYKKTLRKVTATIVALPIAIVTSWVLYQRLVLGEEQKSLPRPSQSTPESSSPSTGASADEK